MAFTTKKELLGASIKRAGEIAALRAENEHLRKYARHYSNCQSLNPMLGSASCSCGFEVKR